MNKQTQVVMFSSKTGQWATPQEFFDKLDWRFGPFNLDPCADADNAKCTKFFVLLLTSLHESVKESSLLECATR